MTRLKLLTIFGLTILPLGLSTNALWAQSTQKLNGPAASPQQPYSVRVQMKPEEKVALKTMVKSKNYYCFVQDLDPLDASSMLLTCLPGTSPIETFKP